MTQEIESNKEAILHTMYMLTKYVNNINSQNIGVNRRRA